VRDGGYVPPAVFPTKRWRDWRCVRSARRARRAAELAFRAVWDCLQDQRGPSRSVTSAHAMPAIGFWPRGLQTDGTDHGAHRQERRVVRAVPDHRSGYIWTFPGEALDPARSSQRPS
jgi:hypothetical protein